MDELETQARVKGRETAGRTIWWRVDDDGEIVMDGGEILAVVGDLSGVQLSSTDSEGATHIHSIQDEAGLETALMPRTLPVQAMIQRIGTGNNLERYPLGEQGELGLYINQLCAFVSETLDSCFDVTVDASASDRVLEVFER